jgi:signal transduction histidine kinase
MGMRGRVAIRRIAAFGGLAAVCLTQGVAARAQSVMPATTEVETRWPFWLVLAAAVAGAGAAWLTRNLCRGRMLALQAEKLQLQRELTQTRSLLDNIPVGRISWPRHGAFTGDAEAAKLLDGVPADAAALAAALKDADASLIAAIHALDSDGIAFDGVAERAGDSHWLKLRGFAAGDQRHLWVEDIHAIAESLTQPVTAAVARAGEFAALLDRLPYPVWRRDAEFALVWCNRAFAQLLDQTPEEVIGQQREVSGAAKALARRAQKLVLGQSESRQLVVMGHRRLFDFHEVPLEDGSMVGFALDQTALEESHAELVRHIAAHDDVLQSLGTGIVIFGPDQRVKFFNAAYREQFGLDAAFLRGEPTIDQVLEAKRERRLIAEQADFRSYKREFIRHVTTLIEPFEDLIHTPGDATFRMVATPHPFGGVTLTFEDVTDKLTMERNYNTLIAVQKETIDQLYEGIAVFGSDGRLKLHNPAYVRLWGLTGEDLEGEPHVSRIVDLVQPYFAGPNDWSEMRRRIVSDVVERAPRALRLERKDGKIIDIAGIPLPDGGKLFKYADVTDSINMERALRDRNEALIAADRLKSEFIANVSYEFRTPLNVIIGYAELLIRQYFGALNQRQAEYAGSILDAAQGLLLMVGDVIDVAAIEAGYIRLDVAEIRLRPVLESVLRLYQQRAHSREIELSMSGVPENIVIRADEQRLKQALANLISNAVGSGTAGSKVEITAGGEGAAIAISVSQTGPRSGTPGSGTPGSGTPGGDAPDGTEFGAAASMRASLGRGTTRGLGMALVKTLIELHGGNLETRATSGRRVVVCTLPMEATPKTIQPVA